MDMPAWVPTLPLYYPQPSPLPSRLSSATPLLSLNLDHLASLRSSRRMPAVPPKLPGMVTILEGCFKGRQELREK